MDDLDLGTTIKGFAPGQRVFARYTLSRMLGRGGMGVVWLAKDEELSRDAALKFLPEIVAADPASINDLKREVRRAIDLAHPHIIKTHDFITDGRTAGVSMEYLAGGTLATRRLEQPGQVFTAEELGPWVHQLCQALQYAHESGEIVHRDLKPTNLMLDAKNRLKVVDFGIAASISDSVSRVSKQVGSSGTPVYMSPQQMMGESPAVTDDVYAVGATLFELLTGKPPFHAGNIMLQVQSKVAPPVNERRRAAGLEPVPAVWEETITACLAKNPAERPQSAMEVAERLGLQAGTGTKRSMSAPPQITAKTAETKTKKAASEPPPAPPAVAAKPVAPKQGLYAGIAAGVVVLGLAGWYFGIYLPEQNRLAEIARLEAEGRAVEALNLKNAQERAVAEAARLAAARGGLVIRTNPSGAEVRVGAVALERSPLTLKDQKLGRYPIRVRLDGYDEWTGEVEVKENEFTDVDVNLVRSSGTVAFTADIGESEAVLTPEAGGQPKSVRAGQSVSLPTGRYRAVIRTEGWADRTQSVEVRAKTTSSLTLNYGTGNRPANWLFQAPVAALQEAAAQGEHGALLQLGDRATLGIPVRDDNEARRWYRAARDAGNPWWEARMARIAESTEETVELWGRALAKGDPMAVAASPARRGVSAENERITPAQLSRATAALEAAANRGDPMAMHELALCYQSGRGVTADNNRAYQWFRSLADLGSSDGMTHVGQALLRGTGVTRDDAAAVGWLRRAADGRDIQGMSVLAGLYRNGQGSVLAKDINAALPLYRRAAEAGDVNSMATLGELYRNGREVTKDFTTALKWTRMAAEKGHVDSMDRLGRMYYQGEGTAQDYAEALKWFRRAADQNHANATGWLGNMAYNGYGRAVDHKEAYNLYRKAESLGITWVKTDLGIMHKDGKGVAQNYTEALRLFREAADGGNAAAMNWLGYMYYYGHGVSVNYYEAASWFRKSADGGNGNSMDWMGLLHLQGQGVAQDLNQAIEWWRKAARAGITNAQTQLRNRNLSW